MTFTYNGSGTAPTAGGSYAVVATVSDSDYAGSATGTMTIEPLTPSVRLSSSNNPAVAQTGVTFTASVSSYGGHANRYGKLPGQHNPARPGDTHRGRGHAGDFIPERWLPRDYCCVQRRRELCCRHQRGIVAVDRRLQSDSRFGQRQWFGQQRHYPNSRARRVGYLSAEHRAFSRHHLPNPGSIDGYRHAGRRYGSHHSLFVDSAHRYLVDFPGKTPLTTLTLTIQLAPTSAGMNKEDPASGKLPPILWGVLLLPFAVRMRRAGKRLRGIIFTLLLTAAGLGALSTLSGCASGNGFFGQQQSSYTVTVTATSGPLTRSTHLTLNVE